MKPEFLFFDLGRVLLDFSHERMVRQMAGVAGVSEAAMLAALMPTGEPIPGDAQWRLEAGELTEQAYYEQLCEKLGVRPPRDEFDHAASDIFEPIEASMRLIERLAAHGTRLGLLSNTNPVHWRFFMDGRYPTLNTAFEIALGSFDLGGMKPAPAIYAAAAERAAVSPERIFFTDDRPENVAGATACGWDAVLFENAAGLERALSDRGLLVA